MPSQEYVFDPQLKRVVSQDKVDKQKDWLTATTEGLSRAGADALDAAGQSINLAPAAHRRHESTPEVHADDEVEEDDYAPLFPATTRRWTRPSSRPATAWRGRGAAAGTPRRRV